MIQQITGLIFLGIAISVGVSQGFDIYKMESKMRTMAYKAVHQAATHQLPTLGKNTSPNPFGCGTYECHKMMTKAFKNAQ